MSIRRRVAALLLLVVLPATTSAEETGATIDDYYIDFGVSDLTALTLIGANSNRVLRPGTMKELAAGFLTVAETSSDIKPGVAVEWTPVRPAGSLRQYRDSKLKYVQLAFGTVKNGEVTDFGFGARWNIFDRSDPLGDPAYHGRISAGTEAVLDVSDSRDTELRLRFSARLGKHLDAVAAALADQGTVSNTGITKVIKALSETIWDLQRPPSPLLVETVSRRAIRYYEETNLFDVVWDARTEIAWLAESYVRTIEDISRYQEQTTRQVNRIVKREREIFAENSWNAPVITVAAGWIARSTDSSWRELKGDRFSGFVGGAFRMGRRFQGIVQADGRVAARDSVDERSFWGLGGRVIAAYGDRRISAEGYYSSVDHRQPKSDTSAWRLTVGLELKLTKGVWFEVALGGEFDNNSDESTILFLGNVKYGVHKEPRFATGG
jgi:hypothetical protein